MNLLFIHGNFPGQFKDIAPALAKHSAGRTMFLTLSNNPQNIVLDGVELRQFKLHRDVDPTTHTYLQQAELAVLKGQAVVRALNQLMVEGFMPDVVICHGGMGFGIYVKALLPTVRLITYLEWYFTIANSDSLLREPSINDHLKLETRNLPLLQEMVQADRMVCPTAWQRQQFPELLRDRIEVIFDGVDGSFFCPGPPQDPLLLETGQDAPLQFSADQLLLSYGTRGMEPLRGFPEFMRAAAAAQQRYPQLQVVVFGNDRSAYGYNSSHESGSWKQQLLEELDGQLDGSRLHFTGLLTYGELVELFRRSDLHCYFTRPYVVSWGVFQAAACGANLLVNRFSGMDEVFEQPPELPAVDLEDQAAVTAAVLAGLEQQLQSRDKAPAAAGRSNLKTGLDLQSSLLEWKKLLNPSDVET